MWDDDHTVEAGDTSAGYVKTRFILSSGRVHFGPEDSPKQANVAGKTFIITAK